MLRSRSPRRRTSQLRGVSQPADRLPKKEEELLDADGGESDEPAEYNPYIQSESGGDVDPVSAPPNPEMRPRDHGIATYQHDEKDTIYDLVLEHKGKPIISLEDLWSLMSEAIKQRERFVCAIARARGVSRPARAREYTEREWLNWYAEHPLDEDDMDEAVNQWRTDFMRRDINEETARRIRELYSADSKSSKNKARRLERGAFKTYVNEICGHFQLAMLFLKHPSRTPEQCEALLGAIMAYANTRTAA